MGEKSLLRNAAVCNWVLPGVVGLLLHVTNFYELGLNAVPLMGPPVGPSLVVISQAYFSTGIGGLAIVSIFLGAVAATFWKGWLAFYLPALLARITTGTVLFLRGDANMWPIFFAGDLILAVASLALFWVAAKVKTKIGELRTSGSRG